MEPWLMDKHVDVVVVGAGPVGLLLAIELTLGGANVMVLERLTAPNLGIKAPSVGPLGAEALQRRGMGLALAEAEDRTFAAMGPAGAAGRGRGFRFRGGFAPLPLPPHSGRGPPPRPPRGRPHQRPSASPDRAARLQRSAGRSRGAHHARGGRRRAATN